ncbi:hypothetical protein ACOME3_003052 [Neoechinorhynchus agilis]
MSSPELIDDEFTFAPSSDEDAEDEELIQLENEYFAAKKTKETFPARAVQQFEQLIQRQAQLSIWGFRSLKQIMKINMNLLRQHKEFLEAFKRMAEYTVAFGSLTVLENMIDKVFDYCRLACRRDSSFEAEFLEIAKNVSKERPTLLYTMNMKLANWAYEEGDYGRSLDYLNQTLDTCVVQANAKKPSSSVSAVILECGARLNCSAVNKNMARAESLFFKAFQFYQDCSLVSPEAVNCFLYAIACHMLKRALPTDQSIKVFNVHGIDLFPSRVLKWLQTLGHLATQNFMEARNSAESIDIENSPPLQLLSSLKEKVILKCKVHHFIELSKPYKKVDLAKLIDISNGSLSLNELFHIIRAAYLQSRLETKINAADGTLQIFNRNEEIER